ncbi:MAG: ATP-binding cassette domain-containing protein [Chitinivibrionales bacterium]|nr:ATP-binding cassette domain-containing protein [Chitinivibrionales bacterium]
MVLLQCDKISLAFGGPRILDSIDLRLYKNQRVCLLGRNGSGKTTLMRVLSGELAPDEGSIFRDGGVSLSYLSQHSTADNRLTVHEILASAWRECKSGHTSNENHDHESWTVDTAIDKIVTQMNLDPTVTFGELSGGLKRRVVVAKALVAEPDVLLLDEPTNHLDLDTICWLQEYLLRFKGALLFVTHDRMLVRKVADRIIEIDRGAIFDWSCPFDEFVVRKQEADEIQQRQWEKFDKKLASEEVWIRKGIKARRTRNEGRVRALERLRSVRSERREATGEVTLEIASADASGKIVAEAKQITFSYGDTCIFRDFSTIIMRGDRIGVVGKNGAGKTTLLNVLMGLLPPSTGTIRFGTNVAPLYFDQMRESIDGDMTVWENVLPNGEMVEINGKKKHIIAYLGDFLFTADRARTPAKNLSGGERNRLLLARLFATPSNFLVLDEPTNDLDVETLELLEEVLFEYAGTLILVSHDRMFLNNVVNSVIALEGRGFVKEYVGGYDDWVRQRDQSGSSQREVKKNTPARLRQSPSDSKLKPKLTYSQKRELEQLPHAIDAAEQELDRIHISLSDGEFYKNQDKVKEATRRMAELESSLEEMYSRWESLEEIG